MGKKIGEFEKFAEFLSHSDEMPTSSVESIKRLEHTIAVQIARGHEFKRWAEKVADLEAKINISIEALESSPHTHNCSSKRLGGTCGCHKSFLTIIKGKGA